MLDSQKIIDIQKLFEKGSLSCRGIARTLDISHQSVCRTLKKLKSADLQFADLLEMEPEAVIAIRYPKNESDTYTLSISECEWIHGLVQKKGQTIRSVYLAWAAQSPRHSMKYSTFCRHYRAFKKQLKLSMKLTHRAGEVVQGDFSGKTLKVAFLPKPVQFFVGVHTHSGRFYVRAT
ncbi:MAG: hypothetical protein AAF988_06590 [Pseudomonadota bacterium]